MVTHDTPYDNVSADAFQKLDRNRQSNPQAFTNAIKRFASELNATRWLDAGRRRLPTSPTWLQTNVREWHQRAHALAKPGNTQPPEPPALSITEDSRTRYLDHLAAWAEELSATTAHRPDLLDKAAPISREVAAYAAALLRPNERDRAITPTGYLALVDGLDKLRKNAPAQEKCDEGDDRG